MAAAYKDDSTNRALLQRTISLMVADGRIADAIALALLGRHELEDVLVVTNSLAVALSLEPAIARIDVVVTGGTLRPLQHSLVGPFAAPMIDAVHIDLAFPLNRDADIDRAQLVGKPIHRVDMRLQKRVNLGGRRNFDAQFEVFNVLNHANYGAYTTTFSSAAQYGKPSFASATAYQPRIVQLGVHFAF